MLLGGEGEASGRYYVCTLEFLNIFEKDLDFKHVFCLRHHMTISDGTYMYMYTAM